MSEIVVEVENLSKQYRLGTVGTGTLVHDVNRLWYRMLGKEDPYLLISETNDRSKKGISEYVWSLKDINFNINQGEVVGIIGRNGAGKSTLLKILSRTTAPTTGNVRIKGRVASLLEVGTGFHPELTGRENVFLNGAILGMTKKEIKRKFNEIVDFSGVERYIDTPVKRYSSGMYVRLAFAVAAHLESEILIVDEVLAVGDIEFQKKCLGKMGDVSKREGRTVLFVSHNIDAILALCNTGMYLEYGSLLIKDNIVKVADSYLNKAINNTSYIDFDKETKLERSGERLFGQLEHLQIKNESNQPSNYLEFGNTLNLNLELRVSQPCPNPEVGFAISNSKGQRFHHLVSSWNTEWKDWNTGKYYINVTIPNLNLYPGQYKLSVWFRPHTAAASDDFIEGAAIIEIVQSKKDGSKQFKDFGSNGGVYQPAVWNANTL